MDEKPIRRRWPRFKLSTILVLVGILAFTMALQPWVTWEYRSYSPSGQFPQRVGQFRCDWLENGFDCMASITLGWPKRCHLLFFKAGPAQLLWSFVLLVAFLTWKWIAARRKRRREQPIAT